MTLQITAQMISTSHIDIIQDSFDNHPPMFSCGSYTQWAGRMKHFIEDKPDGELMALH